MCIKRNVHQALGVIALLVILACGGPDRVRSAASGTLEPITKPNERHIATSDKPALPSRPEPPTVPRTIVTRVEVHQFSQVYLQQESGIAHRAACAQWTPSMIRTPEAAARLQGYTLHAACASLKDPPRYERRLVVHPDWVEYEKQLAAYDAAVATQHLTALAEASSPAVSSTSTASTASVSPPVTPYSLPSASGAEVHVKGYYRKDGTYVAPHTRSKPRK